MAGFYDVYALAPERTAASIERFLTHFVPSREPAALDYPVPHFADVPTVVFFTTAEVIAYCIRQSNEPYSLYWRSLANCDPFHAMAFFTTDGALILGLSVTAEPERWLQALHAATGSTIGTIRFEELPPDTVAAFQQAANRVIPIVPS